MSNSKLRSEMTRRMLLQRAGAIAATGFILPGSLRAAQGVSPITAALSKYMSEARSHELPPEVVLKTKLHVLDTLAAIVSGVLLDAGKIAIDFARGYCAPSGSATVLATPFVCAPIEAALTNGVLAHADETDDSHDVVRWHPGCAVVPAALAVAENFGIGGAHFIRSVALGYDVGTRVMATLQAAGPQKHKSTHSIAGIWGAAGAAACAASLSAQQMRWVIDYTAQQSSGISAWARDTDHVEKGFAFGGMPARSGATSAMVVHAGWTGVDDILTGEDNFILANAPHADPDRLPNELLIEGLGARYEMMRTNIKKWSVGTPIQAPLDALEIMLSKRPIDPDKVKEIVVNIETSRGVVVNDREMPDINVQHMLAVMLMDKTATFESSHDVPRMKDPQLLRHKAKVRLVLVPRDAATKPPTLQLTLTDGTQLTENVRAVKGTIHNPMTTDEVVEKCRSLFVPVLGAPVSGRLISAVMGMEKLGNIRELRSLMRVNA